MAAPRSGPCPLVAVGAEASAAAAEARVEQVADGVAEHVEAVDGERQAQAGPQRQPRRLLHVLAAVPRLSSVPQLGISGDRPKPRKLSDASLMITAPMLILNTTMIGAATLGSTWRTSAAVLVLPVECFVQIDPLTDSLFATERVCPRTDNASVVR